MGYTIQMDITGERLNEMISNLVESVRRRAFSLERPSDSLYVVEGLIEELTLLAEALGSDVCNEAGDQP